MSKELKTLKDLTYSEDNLFLNVCPYDLREEAIKWIKELNKKEILRTPTGKYYYGIDVSLGDVETLTKWIKHFFNIEESELKDGIS
jgi:hypothetical protein